MNIFILNQSPILAARDLCDKHVRKQIIESAQMLANGYKLETLAREDCLRTQKGTVRKHSYPHHPCSKWAVATYGNWLWLLGHASTIAAEYLYRFGKEHFTTPFIDDWCSTHEPDNIISNSCKTTPFVQCMPKQYQNEDTVAAYRDYYVGEKREIATWTNDEWPMWWPVESFNRQT